MSLWSYLIVISKTENGIEFKLQQETKIAVIGQEYREHNAMQCFTNASLQKDIIHLDRVIP